MLAVTIAIAALLAALLGLWISLKRRPTSLMEATAATLLSVLLRKYGVDPERLPNPVLTKIVLNKVEALKASAAMHASGNHDIHYSLFVLLDGEAELIGRILRDGPDRFINLPTTRLLLNHGTVQGREPAGMSEREFLKAIETKTLFMELDRRVALRTETQSR